MLAKLFDTFFGCWHQHYSFPMTVRPGSRRSSAASLTGTYVVCLDCGKEFVLTADEQESYTKKGLMNEPLRCKDCREAGDLPASIDDGL